MKIVEKAVIRNYRWNKIHGLVEVLTAGVLIAIALGSWRCAETTPDDNAIGRWVLVAMLSAISGIGLFLNSDRKTFSVDKNNPDYPLLKRWEQYSGLSLSEFPTSELQLRVLRNWADRQLCLLATQANKAFAYQTDLLANIERDCRATDYHDPSLAISQAKIHEEEIVFAKKLADENKALFLGFWDLVTEKDGLGILTGPEWQDPEAFRKSLLIRLE